MNGSYNYNNAHSNYGGATDVFHPDLDWARDEGATHNFKMAGVWDLPIFRNSKGLTGAILGGWEASTICNFLSGGISTR